jgi:hypothetical protein
MGQMQAIVQTGQGSMHLPAVVSHGWPNSYLLAGVVFSLGPVHFAPADVFLTYSPTQGIPLSQSLEGLSGHGKFKAYDFFPLSLQVFFLFFNSFSLLIGRQH